jgi:hypothetical protein
MGARTVATFICHVQIEAVRLRLVLAFGFVACAVGTLVLIPTTQNPFTTFWLGSLITMIVPPTVYLFTVALVTVVQWVRGPPAVMTAEEAADIIEVIGPGKNN